MSPHVLWDQVSLVSAIFHYRHFSDVTIATAYARQVYSQYLSENAPHKVKLTKGTNDQFKVNISQSTPGPHLFTPVLKELYRTLEHLYSSNMRSSSSSVDTSAMMSALSEDFQLFIREEVCVTRGRRDEIPLSECVLSVLTSSNTNAATWFDITDSCSISSLDESLVNLSSHHGLWCTYFKQFLTERFCAENLSFYLEADDYRRALGPIYRILKARRLYDRYISSTAQLQVNVPSLMARELTAILSAATNISAKGATPSVSAIPTTAAGDVTASSPMLYIAAQREIFLLILNDSVKPYMSSAPWKEFKAICRAKV
jgi:hypothetical protein